jgi:CHASE2 domain-containing sensor protein
MTARDNKKDPAKQAPENADLQAVLEQASIEQKSIEDKRRKRKWEIMISSAMSLSIVLLLIVLKTRFEKTGFGEQVESMTYDLLQHHLAAPTSLKDLSVVVLDISGVEMRPTLGPTPGLVTDRQTLHSIVDELATHIKPAAIGLDVDFSPDSHGYADPDDPGLFDYFLTVNSTIPIRVGVNSSLALGPQKWLGDPKYMKLAACVVVPTPDKGQSTRYMPEELVVHTPEIDEHCPAMGLDLANATQKNKQDTSHWPTWLAESFREKKDINEDGRLSSDEFLVDYSPLEILSKSPPDALDSAALAQADLAGKIVLLGRTKNTTDTFIVPGRPEQVYAGVYLHACAAYTRLNEPLYRLTPFGRDVLDFGFPMLILLPILWLRLHWHKQDRDVHIEHRLVGFLIAAEAAILFLGAVLFVRYTRLMWDDFILVTFALVAHTPVERTLLDIFKWLVNLVWPGEFPPSSTSSPHTEGPA